MKIEIWQHYLGNRNGKCMDIVFQKKKNAWTYILTNIGSFFFISFTGFKSKFKFGSFYFCLILFVSTSYLIYLFIYRQIKHDAAEEIYITDIRNYIMTTRTSR